MTMVAQSSKTDSQEQAAGSRLLHRDTPFSYVCGQCNRCCINKIIKLNPYEVARLAANRRMATTDFIRSFTMAHGTVLNMTPEGACVFRTAQGCGVHPDRPLVCRLYPLGRHVSAEGKEYFSLLPPHPRSEGVIGRDGTVADFLRAQGAAPYIDSIEKYLALLGRMFTALHRTGSGVPGDALSASAGRPKEPGPAVRSGLDLLDMDLTVSAYCTHAGIPLPGDLDQKMALHIRAIETALTSLTKGD